MIQDIYPHVYHNEYTPRPPKSGDGLFVITDAGTLAAVGADRHVTVPSFGELGADSGQYLFSVDDRAYYLWEGAPVAETAAYTYIPSRTLRDAAADETLFACAAAESFARWYKNTKYCGCCGAAMEKGTVERSMVCPACHTTVYPKICPAVIVAVCDGDRLLLTKYAGRAFKRYALVAGFNEVGESIEQTVRREVLEETGVRVGNLRFYKSQPWVYTDSLLVGFFADRVGSDEIRRQEDELSEAGWFDRRDLPLDHSGISLTGEMIELFRNGKEPK